MHTSFTCRFCGKSKAIKSKNNIYAQVQYKGPLKGGIDAAHLCSQLNIYRREDQKNKKIRFQALGSLF